MVGGDHFTLWGGGGDIWLKISFGYHNCQGCYSASSGLQPGYAGEHPRTSNTVPNNKELSSPKYPQEQS